jgi:antitoxin HicB
VVINADHKTLEYYYSLKYPLTLTPDSTGGYVVEINDLPGCISQGETVEEALEMIEEARLLWLESMYEDGNEIPLPSTESEKHYSGKFNVRIPKSLHRKLDEMAEKEGVSLNHYIVSSLSRTVGQVEGKIGRSRKTADNKHSSN